MTLPFPYSARYWFDSGYASLFLAVQTYVAEGFLAVEATRQGSALPLLMCIFKFSSLDRILQCIVEQISRDADRTDLRVPRQKPAADSRTDLRHPSAAGLKEFVEVFTVFSQDSVQHRLLEQISSRSLTFHFRR